MHFLIAYEATLEISLSIHCSLIGKDQREFVFIFRNQNVCHDIPGVTLLPSFFVPIPGNLPSKTKKMLMPRDWPGGGGGGGGAQLELTDV